MALLKRASLWIALPLVVLACHQVFDGELGAYRCSQEGLYGLPGCPEGHTCVGGSCIDIGAPMGELCGQDADCHEGMRCVDPASVGAAGPARCSTVCCASTDCGPPEDGQVCWLPPNGSGSFCWPAAEAGRSSPGPAPAGTDCEDGSACRSGVCEQGRCVDACCDDSYCGESADICRVKPTPLVDHDIWACGMPPGGVPIADCNDDNDCPTGRCEQVSMDARICLEPCCSSSECGTLSGALGNQALVCRPLDGTLRACAVAMDLGLNPRGVGAPCTNAVQCRSGMCDPSGFCSDYCCNDASCGDTGRFACLPVSEGSNWALRCVPK